MREAVAAGLRHIDTAHTYTGGDSEETIGTALSPIPDGCVVATKGGYRAGEGRPEALAAQIDESLRRLRTDSIALYYLHRVDPETPLEKSLAAIKEYRDEGKIRHVGISEVRSNRSSRPGRSCRSPPFRTATTSRSARTRRSSTTAPAKASSSSPTFRCVTTGGRQLEEIAESRGATSAQIALAWLLKRSPTMLPIPGTLSLAHLKENLAALEIELTDDEFQSLR